MMHTTTMLYDELVKTLRDIDLQTKHIKNDIALQYPEQDRAKINVWFWTRLPDGRYVLEDMLAARAQILSGMAALKAADLASKTPKPRR